MIVQDRAIAAFPNVGPDVSDIMIAADRYAKAQVLAALRKVYDQITTEVESGVPDANAWLTVIPQTIYDVAGELDAKP